MIGKQILNILNLLKKSLRVDFKKLKFESNPNKKVRQCSILRGKKFLKKNF